ncbi:HNH endonuclease signature motif containing protein [Peribacillus frigoritolerans]|uniref:HNH endonuclease n=1 Tax=Peribacillus frigoritolerans TaxID=450367 RepID=UPI002B24CCFD|nr:HNH endonuclease signature motif containing protein [Peribacillus frigoritolerans]MEB2630675.1 HNH endonuclease signature motif containing protein [Peribacillus frigoritolerans]
MPRKKICKCGNILSETEKCPCKKAPRRRPKAELERNAELMTTKWKTFRKLIIDRDGAHCKRCLIKFNEVRTEYLQVHHIKPRIRYPELTYEQTNCVTLCRQCNTEYGTKEQLDFVFNPKEQEDIGERYIL